MPNHGVDKMHVDNHPVSTSIFPEHLSNDVHIEIDEEFDAPRTTIFETIVDSQIDSNKFQSQQSDKENTVVGLKQPHSEDSRNLHSDSMLDIPNKFVSEESRDAQPVQQVEILEDDAGIEEIDIIEEELLHVLDDLNDKEESLLDDASPKEGIEADYESMNSISQADENVHQTLYDAVSDEVYGLDSQFMFKESTEYPDPALDESLDFSIASVEHVVETSLTYPAPTNNAAFEELVNNDIVELPTNHEFMDNESFLELPHNDEAVHDDASRIFLDVNAEAPGAPAIPEDTSSKSAVAPPDEESVRLPQLPVLPESTVVRITDVDSLLTTQQEIQPLSSYGIFVTALMGLALLLLVFRRCSRRKAIEKCCCIDYAQSRPVASLSSLTDVRNQLHEVHRELLNMRAVRDSVDAELIETSTQILHSIGEQIRESEMSFASPHLPESPPTASSYSQLAYK